MSEWLSGKGYQAIDVNKISGSWDKPLSDMSIEDIASICGDEADLLLVFHYTDQGDRNYNDQHAKMLTKGLSVISYYLAAFDLVSKERVLMYTPKSMLGIYDAMMADPEIKGDPALKAKIKIINSPKIDVPFERGFWERTRTTLITSSTRIVSFDGFTEDEIIHYAMKYITNGYSSAGTKIVGLNQLIN
jgi:hypothetical protein